MSETAVRTASAPSALVRWTWTGALMVWLVPFSIVTVLVWRRPDHRTLCTLYRETADNFWAGQPLYTGPFGMNYMPQFAVLYSPFASLGAPLGDVLWRGVSLALFVCGLWMLMRRIDCRKTARNMLIASALCMPIAFGSLRNGQANLLLAAVMTLAAAMLLEKRWWIAAALLVIGLAVKPLGLVMLLLAPIVYFRTSWRAAILLVVLFSAMFLAAPTPYVINQYVELWNNLGEASQLNVDNFANLNGIMYRASFDIDPRVTRLLPFIAAPLVAIPWALRGRQLHEPLRVVTCLNIAAAFLMLFNPMNELNSYVILAPGAAALALIALTRSQFVVAAVIGATLVVLGVGPELMRPVAPGIGHWLHPSLTLILLAVLLAMIRRRRGATRT